jgi:hypothetical protein
LAPGLTFEGFTTFMVKPWRMVQLGAKGEDNISLTVFVLGRNIFIQSTHHLANILDQLRVESVRKSQRLLWAGLPKILNVIEALIWRKGLREAQAPVTSPAHRVMRRKVDRAECSRRVGEGNPQEMVRRSLSQAGEDAIVEINFWGGFSFKL